MPTCLSIVPTVVIMVRFFKVPLLLSVLVVCIVLTFNIFTVITITETPNSKVASRFLMSTNKQIEDSHAGVIYDHG